MNATTLQTNDGTDRNAALSAPRPERGSVTRSNATWNHRAAHATASRLGKTAPRTGSNTAASNHPSTRQNPRQSSGFFTWLLGLFLAFFGVTPRPERASGCEADVRPRSNATGKALTNRTNLRSGRSAAVLGRSNVTWNRRATNATNERFSQGIRSGAASATGRFLDCGGKRPAALKRSVGGNATPLSNRKAVSPLRSCGTPKRPSATAAATAVQTPRRSAKPFGPFRPLSRSRPLAPTPQITPKSAK